jgi:hypothetical protein
MATLTSGSLGKPPSHALPTSPGEGHPPKLHLERPCQAPTSHRGETAGTPAETHTPLPHSPTAAVGKEKSGPKKESEHHQGTPPGQRRQRRQHKHPQGIIEMPSPPHNTKQKDHLRGGILGPLESGRLHPLGGENTAGARLRHHLHHKPWRRGPHTPPGGRHGRESAQRQTQSQRAPSTRHPVPRTICTLPTGNTSHQHHQRWYGSPRCLSSDGEHTSTRTAPRAYGTHRARP